MSRHASKGEIKEAILNYLRNEFDKAEKENLLRLLDNELDKCEYPSHCKCDDCDEHPSFSPAISYRNDK